MKIILSYSLYLFICFPNEAFSQLNVAASYGFFTQNFSWSVAGNYAGQNPNIYSELSWDKIKGEVFSINGEYRLHKKFLLNGSFQYGNIKSGNITDADYKSDNRTDRSYYAQFNSGSSNLFYTNLSVGYVLINKKKLILDASLGYGYQAEPLNIRPGKEDSSIITTGLNSSYAITISGPHISTHVQYNLTEKLSIGFLVRIQLLNYDAKADWNLATNFQHPVSFRQLATGYQLNNELRLGYSLNNNLKLFLSLENEHLKTSGGDDVLYKSSGDILISHFNGAKGNVVYGVVGINLKI